MAARDCSKRGKRATSEKDATSGNPRLTALPRRVYQIFVKHPFLKLAAAAILLGGPAGPLEILAAEELTPNASINEFQNRGDVIPSYDFNAPPEGLFREIALAEGFEEELGYRRSHEIVPVAPTEVFRPSSPAVYVVFKTHQHYESYQIFGLCFPEQVDGLDPKTVVAQDVMYMALEDESGYVKLAAPQGGWKPGKYKVEIHIGWQVNDLSLMGTMRFTVQAGSDRKGPSTGSLPPG